METIHLVLRYAHLLGFAALTIGILVQWSKMHKEVNKMMFYGALTQLVTGFALVGILESVDKDLDMTKITIKLGLTVIIMILLFIYKKKNLTQGIYYTLLALIIGASLTAVFL